MSVDTYRDDRLYPRVARAVAKLLAHGTVVAPLDVMINMGLLDKPGAASSEPATRPTLMLAGTAWNSARKSFSSRDCLTLPKAGRTRG